MRPYLIVHTIRKKTMTTPSAASEWLLTLPPTFENDDAYLNELIERRQEMLSANVIRGVVDRLDMFKNNPRYQFLSAVAQYHETIVKKSGNPVLWAIIAARFEAIEPATPMLAFYIANYALLAYRNAAGVHEKRIQPLFERAATASFTLEREQKFEGMGHLHYNVARWYHGKGNKLDALTHWQSSAEFRFMFFGLLKNAKAERTRLLAAAQQVAKMRHDFPSFFPDTTIEECGVEADVYQELQADFGQDLLAFSAAK